MARKPLISSELVADVPLTGLRFYRVSVKRRGSATLAASERLADDPDQMAHKRPATAARPAGSGTAAGWETVVAIVAAVPGQ